MFLGKTAHSGPVTQVDTAALYPLGSLRDEIDGSGKMKIWRYVFNDEAATSFVAGTIVKLDTSSPAGPGDAIVGTTSCASGVVLGVAQHTIAAGEYGWIQCYGEGEVLADTGGFTAGSALVPGNAVAGRADNVTAVTDHAFAVAIDSASATELGTCLIRCL